MAMSERKPPTTAEILARQKATAEFDRLAQNKPPLPFNESNVPAVQQKANVPAVPDNRTSVAKYLDEVAPASIVGRMVKFSKNGEFVTNDDDQKIDETAEFIALCDQTMVGWIRFNDDAPPDRAMGLLYDGFIMPPREELGDTDPGEWPAGLSGQPADPWQHQMYLVLQNSATSELFTFITSSKTGRRAVGNLLHHFDRMLKHNPGELPVVKLKKGGFNHKDDRVGWVATPVFAVVGRAPRDSVAKPDTSVGADIDDEIPFLK